MSVNEHQEKFVLGKVLVNDFHVMSLQEKKLISGRNYKERLTLFDTLTNVTDTKLDIAYILYRLCEARRKQVALDKQLAVESFRLTKV